MCWENITEEDVHKVKSKNKIKYWDVLCMHGD